MFPSKNCVILRNATRDAIAATELRAANDSNVKPAVNVSATSATFKITNTKLYVPIVTLSTEDDNKFLEQLKSGFKRTITWNKYRSEMTNQTKNNNLNYLMIQHLIWSIDYLFYHLKKKKTENPFQSITDQKFK